MTTDGFVTTDDGVRLFFQRVGTGAHVVLIPNGIYLFDDFKRLAANRTLVFYDVRNRGRSDALGDPSMLAEGIHNDVADLDVVRRHFGSDNVDVIGHSYVATTVVLYALKFAAHVRRVVQIGAMPPDRTAKYPPHLTNTDSVLQDALNQLASLEKERAALAPEEFCRRFWSVLRVIYVADPADADKVRWSRCDLPNERNFMKYWIEHLLPSIERLDLTADSIARVTAPVLIIHGTRDRSAPYGAGRDWAAILPNARLVTVENAGHCPWIEAPQLVFDSIGAFLDGRWPAAAEQLASSHGR